MMEQKRIDEQDAFRNGLADVIATAERLAAVCQTLEEMISLCQLALTNDAQLRLLLEKIKQKR